MLVVVLVNPRVLLGGSYLLYMKKTVSKFQIKKILNSVINERDEMQGFEEIEVKPKKVIRLTEQDLETLLSTLLGGDIKKILSSGNMSGLPTNIQDFIKMNPDEVESFLEKPEKPYSSPSGLSTDFNSMVQKIIDNFEGGYYDPVTMRNSAMGDSGETMYGIDRKHGPESNSGKGKEFWDLIHADRRKNPECYKLEYDPAKGKGKCYNPGLANKLKSIIAEMMKPQFDDLSQRYLSPEAKKIVITTPELLFNFTYLVWNGSGYFKKFSDKLNKEVASGNKDPQDLSRIMLDYRKNFSEYSGFANNLIRRGGRNMEKVMMS